MNLLFSLIFSPLRSRQMGAKLRASATNPNKLLAHWKPRTVYIDVVAKGSHAANIFSPNATAAIALPAYLAYASVMYRSTAVTMTMIPVPTNARPMLGIIQ